jgi:hypothetical protein
LASAGCKITTSFRVTRGGDTDAAGVVLHDIPLLRLIEGAVRDPMDVANRAGSQAAA